MIEKSPVPAPAHPLGVPAPVDDAVEAAVPPPRLDRWGNPIWSLEVFVRLLRRASESTTRHASTVDDAVRIINTLADDVLALHRAHATNSSQRAE